VIHLGENQSKARSFNPPKISNDLSATNPNALAANCVSFLTLNTSTLSGPSRWRQSFRHFRNGFPPSIFVRYTHSFPRWTAEDANTDHASVPFTFYSQSQQHQPRTRPLKWLRLHEVQIAAHSYVLSRSLRTTPFSPSYLDFSTMDTNRKGEMPLSQR
jgi:hypothetical protein